MIRKNIIANLVSNVWGIVSVFIFIPLFIKFLGIEAYGLVGFYATLMGFLYLADMGFSATLKRELARISVGANAGQEMRDILRTYEIIYGLISFLISIIIWFSAPLITQYWLTTESVQQTEVIQALRLMGISIAIQLPAGLFIGGLMGLQRQVLANSLNIGIGVLRGFGAVCILWLLSPTIFAFFTWQLVSNIVYLLMSRFRLWRAISSGNSYPKANFNWQVLRNTGRFALNMASISIIGVLLTQTDKLLVSKFATLEMFSYYTIAGSLASLPIILVGAVGSALFPRLTELVALLDQVEMEKVYKKASELIGIFLIPSGLLLVFFSYEFIFAWTGSHLIAKQAGVTASLLLAGQVIQAITVLPYNLAIAHGSVRFSQKLGVYSILLITPLLVFLTMKFGIIGAGASWLILNIFTLPLNLYYLHKQKLSSKNMLKDCLRGVIRPLIITLPIMVIAKLIIPITTSRIELIGELVFVWVVSFILSSMLFSTTRSLFKVIYENISIRLKLKY